MPLINYASIGLFYSYMSTGCSALKLILKNFGNIIKNTITAPKGIGVDISGEER